MEHLKSHCTSWPVLNNGTQIVKFAERVIREREELDGQEQPVPVFEGGIYTRPFTARYGRPSIRTVDPAYSKLPP